MNSPDQAQKVRIFVQVSHISVKKTIDVYSVVPLALGFGVHLVAEEGVDRVEEKGSGQGVEMEGLSQVFTTQIAVVPKDVEANCAENGVLIDDGVEELVVADLLSQDPKIGIER